jgi:hypothetical protein
LFPKRHEQFSLLRRCSWTAVDTSVDASKIPLSTVTTAGDLILGTGNATVGRLAAGSTVGDVLTSNGAGVAPSYQTPSAGVAGDSDQLVLGSQVFS